MDLTKNVIQALPKVELHTHLDGSLCASRIVELAKEFGYNDLPSFDPVELEEWFYKSAYSGNLKDYLAGFVHTTTLMKTKEAFQILIPGWWINGKITHLMRCFRKNLGIA